jgi:hypothetical protein
MKEEPKQKSRTAVEWLKPQIELMLMDGYKSYPNELEEVFEIAKEMEKQQQERMYSKEDMLNFAWFLIKNVGQYSDDRMAHFEGKYLEKFKTK